ncbi:MAG: hypothetical protein PUB32_08445 [Clostridiales bacterium]|nr:hypothetical protein [Clostridiales bacterium]
MTKALFKKQMMEAFSWLYRNRKTGKNRSKAGIIGFGVFYFLIIFGVLGSVFYIMADSLCEPLMNAGIAWLYWAIMGLVTVALGVFGSVFNTYASLYQAKDNDLLLSMPVPVRHILVMRLSGVYFMGLIYELVVIIPALIQWFINGGSLWALQLPLVLSILVLALSCILGWVVALISGKLRNKNIITVIMSLAFIGGYYYIYANAYKILMSILADPFALGEKVKGILYPFYHMGLGAAGNFVSVLIFAAMVAALFAIVYAVLSRSFIALATANKGAAKAKYREKAVKAAPADSALLRKEMRRFLGSANYMLNCGLGVIMMVLAAVALVIFKDSVTEVLFGVFGRTASIIPMLAAAAVCMITTMCDMAAPSVSLEGKSIWLAQSLPVTASQVLMAKLKLQLVLTVPPALLLTAAVLGVLQPSWYFCLLLPVIILAFILFMALLGLATNLKLPNLNWTSEIIPIKQGASVAVALFGGWAVVVALGGVYVLLSKLLAPELYLLCTAVLLFAVSVWLLHWIRTKGAAIFETL